MLVDCFRNIGVLHVLLLNLMTGYYISTVAHCSSLLVIVLAFLSFHQQQRDPECRLIVLNSPSMHCYTCWKYHRSGNFHVKNNLHNCGVKFSQFHSIRNLFNSWQLQYGWAPGEFLAFSLLPGIRRVRYHWLQLSIRHLPRGVWTCVHTYSLTLILAK